MTDIDMFFAKIAADLDSLGAYVASIDAKLKADPVSSEMCGLVREIVDEIESARQIAFLDDAVRHVVHELKASRTVISTLADRIEVLRKETEKNAAVSQRYWQGRQLLGQIVDLLGRTTLSDSESWALDPKEIAARMIAAMCEKDLVLGADFEICGEQGFCDRSDCKIKHTCQLGSGHERLQHADPTDDLRDVHTWPARQNEET